MIEFSLITKRQFKTEDELNDYLLQMKSEHPFGPSFWLTVLTADKATFKTKEPINKTWITTVGEVTHL